MPLDINEAYKRYRRNVSSLEDASYERVSRLEASGAYQSYRRRLDAAQIDSYDDPNQIDDDSEEEEFQSSFSTPLEDVMPILSMKAREMMMRATPEEGGGVMSGAMLTFGTMAGAPQHALFRGSRVLTEGIGSGMERSFEEKSRAQGVGSVNEMNAEIERATAGITDPVRKRNIVTQILRDQARRVTDSIPGKWEAMTSALKSAPGAYWESLKTGLMDTWTGLTGSTQDKIEAMTNRREDIKQTIKNSGFNASDDGGGLAAGIQTALQAPFAPLIHGAKGFKLLYSPSAWVEAYNANKELINQEHKAGDPNESITTLTELFADPLNVLGASAAFRSGAAKSATKALSSSSAAWSGLRRAESALQSGVAKALEPAETAVRYGANLGNTAAFRAAKLGVTAIKQTGRIPLPSYMRNDRLLTQTFGSWARVNFSNTTAAAKALAFGSRGAAGLSAGASEVAQALSQEFAKVVTSANKMAGRANDLATMNDMIGEIGEAVFAFADTPPQIKGLQAEKFYMELKHRRAVAAPGAFDTQYPGVSKMMDAIERGDIKAKEAAESLSKLSTMYGIGEAVARRQIPFDTLAPIVADAALGARSMTMARLIQKEAETAILRATGALNITPAMANDTKLLAQHVAATFGPVYKEILDQYAKIKHVHGGGVSYLAGWAGHHLTDMAHQVLTNLMPSSAKWKATGIVEGTVDFKQKPLSRIKEVPVVSPTGVVKKQKAYLIRNSKVMEAHQKAFTEILTKQRSAILNDPHYLALHNNDPVRALNAKAIEEGIKKDPVAQMIENSMGDEKVIKMAERILELREKSASLMVRTATERQAAEAAVGSAPYKGGRRPLSGMDNRSAYMQELVDSLKELDELEASREFKRASMDAYRQSKYNVKGIVNQTPGQDVPGGRRAPSSFVGPPKAQKPGNLGNITRKYAKKIVKISRSRDLTTNEALAAINAAHRNGLRQIQAEARRQGITISKPVIDDIKRRAGDVKRLVTEARDGVATQRRAAQDLVNEARVNLQKASAADKAARRADLAQAVAARDAVIAHASEEASLKAAQAIQDFAHTTSYELRQEISAAKWINEHAPTKANLARADNLARANITRIFNDPKLTAEEKSIRIMRTVDNHMVKFRKATQALREDVDLARARVTLHEMVQAVGDQYSKFDDLVAARESFVEKQRIYDERMAELATFWDDAIDKIVGPSERRAEKSIAKNAEKVKRLRTTLSRRMSEIGSSRYTTFTEDIDAMAGQARMDALKVGREQSFLPTSDQSWLKAREHGGSAAKKNSFYRENLGIEQAYAEDPLLIIRREGREAAAIATRHDILTHLARELEEGGQGVAYRATEPRSYSQDRPFWSFLEASGIDRAGAQELYNMTNDLWVTGTGYAEAQAVMHRMGKAEQVNAFVRAALPFQALMAKYTLAFPKFVRNNLATGLWFNHTHLGIGLHNAGEVYDAALRYVRGDAFADKLFPPGSKWHKKIDITKPDLIGEINDRVIQSRGRTQSTISASAGQSTAVADWGGTLGPLREKVIKGKERLVPIGSSIAERTKNIPIVGKLARAVGATGRNAEKYAQTLLHLGADIDNVMRIAAYLELRVKRGMPRNEALATVRKYHFDLDLLSPAERALSSAGFYFPWSRHAIPFAVQAFIDNPMAYYHGYQAARLGGLETTPDITSSPYDTYAPTFKAGTINEEGDVEKRKIRVNWMPEADAVRLASTLTSGRPAYQKAATIAEQHGNPWFDIVMGSMWDSRRDRPRSQAISMKSLPFNAERAPGLAQILGAHKDPVRDRTKVEHPWMLHMLEAFPPTGRAMSEAGKLNENPTSAITAQVIPADVSTTDRNREFFTGMQQMENAWRRNAGTLAARGYITEASMERDPAMWGLVGKGLIWRRQDPEGYRKFQLYLRLYNRLQKMAYGASDRREKAAADSARRVTQSIGR